MLSNSIVVLNPMLVKAKGMGFILPAQTESLLQVAGRLALFINTWKVFTKDYWVLQTVKRFQIPFVGQPVQERKPGVASFPSEQLAQMQEEVSSLLEKGAIIVVDSHTPQTGFYSVLFLEEWANETSYQPQSPQPVGRNPSFQNGRSNHPPRPFEAGRLVSKSRLKRCIPHSTSASGPSMLPSFQRRGSLPVSHSGWHVPRGPSPR